MIGRTSRFLGLPFGAALCALAGLAGFAPLYLRHQGFPLDDAWIHAVYARELAHSGLLAYNPGVPATGETAPLWALALASVHKLAGDGESAVASTKALGFALHVASAALLGLALGRLTQRAEPWVWMAAALVAFHPDLVAASVSGMEVPLATLIVAGIVAASVRGSAVWVAVLGALAVAGRPETAVFAAAFPLLFWARTRPAAGVGLAAVASGGSVLSMGLIGLRNYSVSGMPLPATFYAKVNVTAPFDLAWQVSGFRGLLGQITLVDSSVVLAAATVVSIVVLGRAAASPPARAAAAMCVSGLVYCAVSFVLVHPTDPTAFYHQRYVLPAVFPIVAALPLLAHEAFGGLPYRTFVLAYGAALAAMIGVMLQATPLRYRRLSNDAHNIDDVQVAFGRALETASVSDNAWVVDAGASRFFGKPFVVDLMGLNTPEILGPNAQSFLDDHAPRYLDLFPGWSRIELDEPGATLSVRSFETSTPYTVTSDARMGRHGLVSCNPPGTSGRVIVRGRTFTFRCRP